MFRIKFFIIVILCFIGRGSVSAQNLFANGGFEEMNICTEYHIDCSQEAWFYLKPALTPYIDLRRTGQLTPFSGKDMLIVPIENVVTPGKRSFVYTMLLCPLKKGKEYTISFYLNTTRKKFYGIDMYMRRKEFTSDNFSADTLKPAVHFSPGDTIASYKGWMFFQKKYTAAGDEKFCLFGNLSGPNHFHSYDAMNRDGDVLFFMDDASFTPVIPEPLCTGYSANKEKLYAQDLRHTERVLPEEEYVTDTITIPAVFFETDQSKLKPVFRKLLDSLSLKLKQRDVAAIVITGHTDTRGTEEHNVTLSTQRADAVRDYLLLKMPELQDHISSAGRASTLPVADNKTNAGRAKNRRVEMVITSAIRPQ